MRNFVIQFRFENSRAREVFMNRVERTYKDRLINQVTEEFTYYLIWEHDLPTVEDTLDKFIYTIQIEGFIREGDYVAVFFSSVKEPDQVKREMVFGKAEYIDHDLKKSYQTLQETVIEDLLNYNFLKHQA